MKTQDLKKYWTPENKKRIIVLGTLIAGYSLVSQAFTALPFPEFFSKTIFRQVSLLTVAGGITIYSAIRLYTHY